MNLSELVRLRNQLTETNQKIIHEIEHNKVFIDCKNFAESLSEIDFKLRGEILGFFTSLNSSRQKLQHDIYQQSLDLERLIDAKAERLLHRGYQINGSPACAKMSAEEERLTRIVPIDPDLKNIIKGIISLKTRPEFAGLEIGPGDGFWTEYLVAADPLYILDIHPEFLESTKNRFPESYKPRLRSYLWNEDEVNQHYLEKLPEQQFGFVFAYNVFDFFAYDFLDKWLTGIKKVLRPGGSAFFTYNNCENYDLARYAETGFKSWMPKHLLEKMIKHLGFEIESFDNYDKTFWCIIRKPGSLRTVKATQALGRIVHF